MTSNTHYRNVLITGKPLTYARNGKAYPALPSISQESTKNAALWQLSNVGNGQVTLEAAQRASCCPANLGYQLPCNSTVVQLLKKGAMRWTVKPNNQGNTFLLLAAVSHLRYRPISSLS
jgi:hypothetical protein